MASSTLDIPTQVIQQKVTVERNPSRWGFLGLFALVPVFVVVWIAADAVFSVESRTDKIEDYLHAIEAEPYHQVLNTRYRLLEACEEAALMAYCKVEERNELYDRAGLDLDYEMWFLFDEDGSIDSFMTCCRDSLSSGFLWDYEDWLETTHPDVWRQLPRDGWGYCCAETRETAIAFVAHIDEYLAETSLYR